MLVENGKRKKMRSRGDTRSGRKKGSGGVAAPLRKKFQHVKRALKVWFSGRGGTICSRKTGSGGAAAP